MKKIFICCLIICLSFPVFATEKKSLAEKNTELLDTIFVYVVMNEMRSKYNRMQRWEDTIRKNYSNKYGKEFLKCLFEMDIIISGLDTLKEFEESPIAFSKSFKKSVSEQNIAFIKAYTKAEALLKKVFKKKTGD